MRDKGIKLESTIGRKGYEPSMITIYVKNKGIVLEESSMLLVNQDSSFIMAMGNEAERAMDTAAPPAIAVNPLRRGIIASYTAAAAMFRCYLRKALGYGDTFSGRLKAAILPKPSVVLCVPEPLTEVEEKAFSDVLYQAGAKKVLITEMSLEQAKENFSDQYPVIAAIRWSGYRGA